MFPGQMKNVIDRRGAELQQAIPVWLPKARATKS
jgi:hypothetical protein